MKQITSTITLVLFLFAIGMLFTANSIDKKGNESTEMNWIADTTSIATDIASIQIGPQGYLYIKTPKSIRLFARDSIILNATSSIDLQTNQLSIGSPDLMLRSNQININSDFNFTINTNLLRLN
ncbi:MAG: hypothetical protein AAGK97_17885 [Bacteroidota bacterium]